MNQKEIYDLELSLAHFHGTSQWYRVGLPPILITDGVKYLADKAGAYWLCDVVASWQIEQAVRKHEFQVWRIRVSDDRSCVVDAWSDEPDDSERITRQEIPYTDFPLPEFKLWYSGGALMLPSEY